MPIKIRKEKEVVQQSKPRTRAVVDIPSPIKPERVVSKQKGKYSSDWCRCKYSGHKFIIITAKQLKKCCAWKKKHSHCPKCEGTVSVG